MVKIIMVPRRGLEPPHRCQYQHLKLARLPIPPSGLSEKRLFLRGQRLKAAIIDCQ